MMTSEEIIHGYVTKTMIERMPSDKVLAICRKTWDLTDLIFVRKMENIVFSCQRHGQTVFLRLTTPLRRSKPQIEAELHFMTHLTEAGLRVPRIIPYPEGQDILTLKDEDQIYQAVLFTRVEGEHPSPNLVVTSDFLRSFGALIATMHQVSEKYEPLSGREHWHEERGIRHALEAAKVSKHPQMRKKLDVAMKWMHSLEKTPSTYGLVHADLGAMNLFVKPDASIGVIDFDDSCYHFYAFDLAIAIYSMTMRFGHSKPNDVEKTWMSDLIEGYRTLRHLTQEQVEQIPRFMDYACLRLYFWIEYHESLNTFHQNEIERVLTMKQWAHDRIIILGISEEDKLEITTQIATALIVEQFPQFAHLHIRPVDNGGNDNRTFRLGSEMSIRLPSAEEYVRQVQKEQKWLPKIAPHLPLPISQPIAMGIPSEVYPWHWSIYKWLEGESANSLVLRDAHLETIAAQLAQFLTEFHKFDGAGAPAPGLHNWWRAAHTSVYDAETRSLIEELKDFINVDSARKLWQRAINSTWNRDPVWVHGDVASGNLLVKDNKLAAVIDFGCMGIGDPACDLTIAWTFFRGKSREIFRANMGLDEETWARARGWAMWKALYEISVLEDKSGAALAKELQIIDAVMEEN